jgi:hypothetical protein
MTASATVATIFNSSSFALAAVAELVLDAGGPPNGLERFVGA